MKGSKKDGIAKRKIAVITANMDVEYASEILQGIYEVAKGYGYDISVFNAFSNQSAISQYHNGQFNIFNLANFNSFDGAILFSNLIRGERIYKSLVDRMKKAGIPVVCIDGPVDGFYYVGVENYQSMKVIVEHFIQHHKFTEINCVAGQVGYSDNQVRVRAYKDALEEAGIEVEEDRIFWGSFSKMHGREAATRMLAYGEKLPQAVVCASDDIALGVCSVFEERGIRVPEDVAVSGFDNTFKARNAQPRITTVDRSLVQVGREAVNKLKADWAGENPEEREVFPATPIFAESCGCGITDESDEMAVREKYLSFWEHFEKNLYNSNYMTEDLNDNKSFEDMLFRLRGYIATPLACKSFYLCLDSNLVQYLRMLESEDAGILTECKLQQEGYAPVMSVVLAYENGEFVECEEFLTSEMWPNLEKLEEEGGHSYIFSPLHFRDFCQGYVIVEDSEFAATSMLYRSWLVNLSNCLENIRRQASLQYTLRKTDRMSITDQLTGLYNRNGFAKYTADSFRSSAGKGSEVMVLFADMDGLKKINDKYGHDKGDLAIMAIADALRGACLDNEVCARFGGDEYVVYAENYNEEDARQFCARFALWLTHCNTSLNQPFKIGASYGYKVFVPKEDEGIDKYIDRADEIMYDAKRAKYEK